MPTRHRGRFRARGRRRALSRDMIESGCAEFALTLHPEKTRLIEFGRFCGANVPSAGSASRTTCTFLDCPAICGETRRGSFQIGGSRARPRCAKLRESRKRCASAWHVPIPDTGNGSGKSSPVTFAYHAVPTNSAALGAFRYHVTVLWHRRCRRRSQKARLVWARMGEAGQRLSPPTADPSSLAECALRRQTPEVGAQCPNWARSDLCGGRSATNVPTANAALLAALCASDGRLACRRRPLRPTANIIGSRRKKDIGCVKRFTLSDPSSRYCAVVRLGGIPQCQSPFGQKPRQSPCRGFLFFASGHDPRRQNHGPNASDSAISMPTPDGLRRQARGR